MTKKEKVKLIESIEKGLASNMELPHQACSLGVNIFLLSLIEEKMIVGEYLSQFFELLSSLEFGNLTENQADYAIRIASIDSKSKLIFEDMFKLFSLCDDIYALEAIGIGITKS